MPLVWELTGELRRWLTPDKLRDLNANWRAHGTGYSDEVIEECVRALQNPEMHYESILGHLEVNFRRYGSQQRQQQFHGLYSWLVEIVSHLLYLRHVSNREQIEHRLRELDGIVHLADNNEPLWIFSLNHDVVVECAATKHSIPVNSGFGPEIVTLPRRDGSGTKVGELRAEVLAGDQLQNRAMPFFQPGTRGINLLKIHGALDVFTFRNGEDVLKLLPDEPGVPGVLNALHRANTELVYRHPNAPGGQEHITNEIAYADDHGEMQFLRRSLLAGAYKFDPHRDQVLPKGLLKHFRSNLNYVSTLLCIGYGFGDLHINAILREWLEQVADRRIEIVSPGLKSIPSSLLHLAPQVTLVDSTATDYLDNCAGIKRDRRAVLEKRFAAWARGYTKERAQRIFAWFTQRHLERVVEVVAERMSCGAPFDSTERNEFVGELVAELGGTTEGLLEAFLENDHEEMETELLRFARHHRISEAAYFRWLSRGATHGRDVEDWLEAEAKVGDGDVR